MRDNKKVLILLMVIVIILVIIISLCIIIKKINIDESESSGSEIEVYDKNIEGLQLSIEGMSENTISKINDMKEFEKQLKAYAYENELVNYNESNFKLIGESQKGRILTLKLQVKDISAITVIVDINLDANTYQFYNYK